MEPWEEAIEDVKDVVRDLEQTTKTYSLSLKKTLVKYRKDIREAKFQDLFLQLHYLRSLSNTESSQSFVVHAKK